VTAARPAPRTSRPRRRTRYSTPPTPTRLGPGPSSGVPGTSPSTDPACDPSLGGGWPEACFAFPAHQIPADTPERQSFLGAAWNLFYIANDRSRGIHNTAFAVSVLQRSYRAVTGVDVPGATLR
jgi:hypothetical protein